MNYSPTRPLLNAKVALVTDASNPLGSIISRALAQQGWDLALHYGDAQPPALLLKLVKECENLGHRVHLISADLADETQVKSLIPRIIVALGSLTCVVNNAARVVADVAADFSASHLERHMRTNLAAPILLAQSLHATTAEGAQAVVINLLDQKLFNPAPDFLSYTLSKAALQKATDLLALALAPRVRVVGIAPALNLDAPGLTLTLDTATTADDFAASICFIASSTAVTGTTLLIDGGAHLRARSGNRNVIVPTTASALSAT